MKRKIIMVLLATMLTTNLMACGSNEAEAEGSNNKNISVSTNGNSKEEEKDYNEDSKLEEKQEEKEEEKEEKKDIKTDVVTDALVESGAISAEGIPLFEELYKDDELKDFKVEFATEALNKMDMVANRIPAELKEGLFTSRGIIQYEGPINKFSIQATGDKDGRSKENNFYGLFGDLFFYDEAKYLKCEYEIKLVFYIGSDTEIILTDEAKDIINTLMPEVTVDEVQNKMNETLANEGKKIEIVEEKYKEISVMGSFSNRSNSVSLRYKISKDY